MTKDKDKDPDEGLELRPEIEQRLKDSKNQTTLTRAEMGVKQKMKVAYVISRYTNENSNFKRHMIDNNGKPICMSHTRSFSLEYTEEQCNCLRCLRKETKWFKALTGDSNG